jgi:limonene-1,2-epoxide hydrolase
MTTTTATKSTSEVAHRLIELCREGKNMDAVNELYADHILSLEPKGSMAERTEGKEAVIEKETGFFMSVEEVHSSEVSEPLVAENFFSLTMKMDMTIKGMGRMKMDEVCVFEVNDGKIVFEQFFFTPMNMQSPN